MRPKLLVLLTIAVVSVTLVSGCATFEKPRPVFDVPFLERSQSKVDGDVKVTVAVPSNEESKKIFGVNLAGKGSPPGVGLSVERVETIARENGLKLIE